ncbi:hypothetical protein GGTG_07561 [Gaeumannomyces tritici R3-111a-1]|uniref:Uncharacterized protein n=1 Tax=Gaeumannomyces tritici (strain R3-111a-1) TaxID=644352 RepID=J3P213_GAET3|nr:hypothetical protein GGTG_07561 [Gaeumannomyces tritici R3-111a-1]EJT73705.1 hypothetical protein GGTG_07561 [Gaeumannomyces tritici R3-111a-1]
MSNPIKKSHFVAGPAVYSTPAEAEPFVPGKLNAFPKYADAIGAGSEVWIFDAVSEKDHSAIVVSMSRGMRPAGQDDFRVQVLGLWPDQSTWHQDFFFPESIVTETEGEDVTGVWQDEPRGTSISWTITEAGKKVKLVLNMPGMATGTLEFTAPPGDSGLDIDPWMGPQYMNTRPLPRGSAECEVDMGGRRLAFGPDGPHKAHGAIDHGWCKLPWPRAMSYSLYIHAQAGPYAFQICHIRSPTDDGKVPYLAATLFHDGRLVCSPKRVAGTREEAEKAGAGDALVLGMTLEGDGLTGAYSDKNAGYRLEWYRDGQRWVFDTRHAALFWNIPTSPPGPNQQGNTCFVDTLVGGAEGEGFQGACLSAQCDWNN